MRDTLTDIREKLQHGEYQNEEHIRLALVCRLLSKLGWNIWNPKEVNTEFQPIPSEDRTRVDIALFANKSLPSVFIEAKAIGKVKPNLSDIERQVRDYNRNNTALFSVITDGRLWRFYYSQTGGEFQHKCFKECDILEYAIEDLEQIFILFLGKENIQSGHAEEQAQEYLQSTNMQKAVWDCLPHAKRMVQSPPYPSLPQAIVKMMEQKGFTISEDKAAELLEQIPPEQPIPAPYPPPPTPTPIAPNELPLLNPDNPGDLRFTKVEGTIDRESGRKWKELIDIGIRLAVRSGHDVRSLNAYLPANIREGIHTTEGYSPIKGLDISVQGMDANKSANTLVLLAKKLNCRLELTVSWYGESPSAGNKGIIRWPS